MTILIVLWPARPRCSLLAASRTGIATLFCRLCGSFIFLMVWWLIGLMFYLGIARCKLQDEASRKEGRCSIGADLFAFLWFILVGLFVWHRTCSPVRANDEKSHPSTNSYLLLLCE